MEKVNVFLHDLKERHKISDEKLNKAEYERATEEAEIVKDLLETADDFIQAKKSLIKNLNFLTLNKHSILKGIQEGETTKGLQVSNEYQQPALKFFTESITFVNKFKDVQKVLEADKNTDSSNLASDLVVCTRTVENELKKVRSSLNQVEALHSKVEEVKSTLFVPERYNFFELRIIDLNKVNTCNQLLNQKKMPFLKTKMKLFLSLQKTIVSGENHQDLDESVFD